MDMFYYILALAGIAATYTGINKIVEGLRVDSLYEDARKNRIRVLNQQGDTE